MARTAQDHAGIRDAIGRRSTRTPEVNAVDRTLQRAGGRRDEDPIFTGASIQA
jgi:hypothetical protein